MEMWLSDSTATPDTPPLRREVMQMDMQQGCARYLHASLERALDVLDIIKAAGTEQIHQTGGCRHSATPSRSMKKSFLS